MIKYLELTAPEKSEFRQAKIVSVEVNEGDHVEIGDTLFRVKSGSSEIDLPTTMKGNITEIIATEGESISIMTPLVLLETEVEESSASQPISEQDTSSDQQPEATPPAKDKPKKSTKKRTPRKKKDDQQQSLNLGDNEQQDNDNDEPDDSSVQDPASDTMSSIDVSVPDIGGDSAKVIEILVKVGDQLSPEDPIVTLESDKASMDVPSPNAGTVSEILVQLDDDVSEGTVLLRLHGEEANEAAQAGAAPDTDTDADAESEAVAEGSGGSGTSGGAEVEVAIPDIGGDSAKVIEILVAEGDKVTLEDPLVTLESDKASMDVPNTVVGTVSSIDVEIDQDVTEGVVIMKIIAESGQTEVAKIDAPAPATTTESKPAPAAKTEPQAAPSAPAAVVVDPGKAHASPSIRRFARELGVQLSRVSGSGRKGRITKSDVKQFVKGVMTSGSSAAVPASGGSGIPAMPEVDFTKFGEVDIQPLNKIKRLTAKNLHRSWLNVPHVTHNDEADITDLEAFRKEVNEENKNVEGSVKLSPLAFIVKAVVRALQQYPQFNSSLDASGENLIYKQYIHIGIAVETPNGLVVPVIKDADKMSVSKIAKTMGELAAKARDKKLSPADMSGACFTISSLGGIGGTHFTPIVNAPEVAILGVSRTKIHPVWNGEEFKPAPMLPLSLSYDHRVIDGAEAARFTRHLATVLEDVRRLTV
ncbi:MAG: dihydrolipoyllysine-residue acetyltransferase [Gammaproteobacteria bacterium]|nr:dihydrolipoyllysine-residue acetyltransferase [Gammaproteobacteria bacterium]